MHVNEGLLGFTLHFLGVIISQRPKIQPASPWPGGGLWLAAVDLSHCLPAVPTLIVFELMTPTVPRPNAVLPLAAGRSLLCCLPCLGVCRGGGGGTEPAEVHRTAVALAEHDGLPQLTRDGNWHD